MYVVVRYVGEMLARRAGKLLFADTEIGKAASGEIECKGLWAVRIIMVGETWLRDSHGRGPGGGSGVIAMRRERVCSTGHGNRVAGCGSV